MDVTPEWRDVPGFDGYQVSDDGHVRNKAGLIFGTKDRHGYRRVVLKREELSLRVRVNTLVLSIFEGRAPKGAFPRHKNGDPGDCRISNLHWETLDGQRVKGEPLEVEQ